MINTEPALSGRLFFFSNGSNYMKPLICATADAFRGHGLRLLITPLLRGLQFMLFPQKSPPHSRVLKKDSKVQILYSYYFYEYLVLQMSVLWLE